MKIKLSDLKGMVERTVKEMIRESLVSGQQTNFPASPVEKSEVWETVVENIPEYGDLGISWNEDGIIVAPIGENYAGGTIWVVIAEPFDAPAGGFLVHEIIGDLEGEVNYEFENIGLEAAKDEYYGPNDTADTNW